MVENVIHSFANKASEPRKANLRLKQTTKYDSQCPDNRSRHSLRMTEGHSLLTLLSLIIASITSLLSCKVGEAIYSSMLTIIMPISCLMLHLEANIKDDDTRKAFSLFVKLAYLGLILVVSSSFIANDDDVIINNYIPIINNLTFIVGLSIFLASSFLTSLISGSNSLRVIFILAASSLIISYRKIFYEITYPIDLHGYFEMLFLGPASCVSVISIYLIYQTMQKLLTAKSNFMGEYPPMLAGIIIVVHHFLSKIDSATFFSLSSIHIQMINVILVIFIFLALFRYLKISSGLAILSLLSMLIFTSLDLYKADQGNSIEYFNMYRNFGITISIMSYLSHILVDGRSYLMKSIKSQIIVYSLSTLLIILDFMPSLGKFFTSISMILFAIFCIINIILKQRKLEKK